MKKIITLTLILVAAFTVSSFAQDGRERFRQMMKDRLKEELKIEDAVADSVIAVQMSFQPKQREIIMDQALSPEQKQEKMKAVNDEMSKGFKKFLTDDQIKKYQDMLERQRQARQNGGGRGNK